MANTTKPDHWVRQKRSAAGGVRATMAFLLLALTSTAPASANDAETLVVQGSTTFNASLMQPFQKSIEGMAGVRLQLIPNKSSNGLTALLEGRADLAMISASLESELPALRGSDRMVAERLQGHQITSTRVAFAVHPSNPLRQTSIDNVRRILSGDVTNWQALGGPDLPIRLAFVGKAGGVTHSVQSHLLGGSAISAAHPIALSTPEQVIKVVEQEPGALGLAQLRLVAARQLPELATEEIIEQVLVLVTLGEPSPAAQRVIEAVRVIASKRTAISQ